FSSMTFPTVGDDGRDIESMGLLQCMQNLAAGKLSRPQVGQFMETQRQVQGRSIQACVMSSANPHPERC
ncbi:MAG: hypothetical protein ACRD2L_09390, partial [Terriglobia bacterium]